jgi:hypothetical protein
MHLPNAWKKLVQRGEEQLAQARSLLDALGVNIASNDYILVQEQLR